MYIHIRTKFILTCILATLWAICCFVIDRAWFNQLWSVLGLPLAIIVVIGIAILPGVMICFFSINGLAFDKPRHLKIVEEDLEPITILIAAYNEEDCIYDTLESLSKQRYPYKLLVKVIDNNSTDGTKNEILRAKMDFSNLNIKYFFEKTQGKYAALNAALKYIETNYFITIDADTYLYKDAIITLANSMMQESKNKKVAAIAGTILVRNSRTNLLTKLQEWEYFLSIATIKRSQGLFQTTMVAQGAFSIYKTDLIRRIGGYKDAIAEDIVLTWEALSLEDRKEKFRDIHSKDMALTWDMLSSNDEYRTYYCDNALAFTNVPVKFKHFVRQRKRWARGSIEGFRHFSFKTCKNPYTKFYMLVNYVNIIGELSTTFIFIPGFILAVFFHNYLFVGKSTILLFFVTMFIYLWMWHKQLKYVFEPMGLKVRRHYGAFVIYTLFYAMLLAPICLSGYLQELFNTKREWK